MQFTAASYAISKRAFWPVAFLTAATARLAARVSMLQLAGIPCALL
jgi:hypothetical protein